MGGLTIRSRGPLKNGCQKEGGRPIPKWKAKRGQEAHKEVEVGLSIVGPLQSGRLIQLGG